MPWSAAPWPRSPALISRVARMQTSVRGRPGARDPRLDRLSPRGDGEFDSMSRVSVKSVTRQLSTSVEAAKRVLRKLWKREAKLDAVVGRISASIHSRLTCHTRRAAFAARDHAHLVGAVAPGRERENRPRCGSISMDFARFIAILSLYPACPRLGPIVRLRSREQACLASQEPGQSRPLLLE